MMSVRVKCIFYAYVIALIVLIVPTAHAQLSYGDSLAEIERVLAAIPKSSVNVNNVDEAATAIGDHCRKLYVGFLEARYNRAFVTDGNKCWLWRGARGVEIAVEAALSNCKQENPEGLCLVYAVNDRVVFDRHAWEKYADSNKKLLESPPNKQAILGNVEKLGDSEKARRQQEALARAEEARRQQEALARAEEARRQQEALARAEEARRQQEALARAEEARRQPRKNHQENTTLSVRKALVLGNDSYQNVPVLRNARSDASSIEQALSGLGYAVTAHYDVNEREMKKAVRDFIRTISGGDEVVFFYAGHGVQINSANYLLPVDIRSDDAATVRDESMSLQRILDDLAEAKARVTVAIIDACRDDPFQWRGRNLGGRGLAATSATTGQVVMFAAGAGQKALDTLGPNDRSPNGVFTRTLLKHIRTPDISVDRLLRQVRTEVVNLTKSVGHDQVPALYDQLVGDFYVVR